ncbi:hypothetical protein LLG90_26600, partial [Aromatoleum toluclasticum]|uniref:hypothetical protein n=1 Tax=Aromatoleum toluclasticum TaxID=92003 RepID=UPI001D197162
TTTRPVGKNEPWNGEFYHSFGHSNERSWDDAVKYGFISDGGGRWYSNTLQLLGKNDRVWANVPGAGFVGVGRVKGPVQSIQDFVVQTEAGEKSILEVGHRS